MNWTKILLVTVVGGLATNIVDFLLHGLVLGSTYMEYEVFTQEQANPLWFLLISVLIALFAAILFARTRASWADGVQGGLAFGLLLGLLLFWQPFYSPLVLEGFPYFLSWAQGAIGLVDGLVFGLVAGAIYKRP